MIERASPELLPSSGINASGKPQTCDLSPALSPVSLPHPLNLDSGGVRTQRASWAGRGGEQGGMMEGRPGLAWKLSGEGACHGLSHSFLVRLASLYPSPIRCHSRLGGAGRRGRRDEGREVLMVPSGRVRDPNTGCSSSGLPSACTGDTSHG